VCRRAQGNRKSHVCPYHGWTYDSRGENVNITNLADGAYSAAFDPADKNLLPIARFDSYRGLMFGCLRHDVPALPDHLGPVKTFIDLICDQSPDGFDLVPGRVIYTYNANWKWQIENLTDSYHFPVAHSTYLGVLQRQVGRERKAGPEGAGQGGISSYSNMRHQRKKLGRGCFDLGNGHSAMWGHTPNPEGRPLHLARDEVIARVGETRGEWMFRTRNLNVYPNLQFHDNIASMIAIVRPISAGRTEMVTYCIGPKGESAEGRRRRIRHCEEFLNFGIANPDDLACYEACQAGFAEHPDMWLDYARGMTLLSSDESPDAAELGFEPRSWMYGPFDVGDETGHQHSYREWAKLLKRGLLEESRP
jgi:phenylpropionate dioxygenase-like ring-hydroxylating dioxygenase large terminal subunit